MKLEQLNEGLIKLPEKMLAGMIRYTALCWFTYYLLHIEEELVGKEYHEAHEMMKKAIRQYGVSVEDLDEFKSKFKGVQPSSTIPAYVPVLVKSFDVSLEDLPPAYVKKLIPDVYKTDSEFFSNMGPTNVRLYVDFNSNMGATGGRYTPTQNKITLYIRTLNLTGVNLGSEMAREDCIEIKFPRLLGTLEHELTHAVQFMVLRWFHDKQIEYKDNGKIPEENLESYVSSNLEFDPLIKTAVSVFKAIAKRMKATDPNWDQFEAFRFFTCSDGISEPSEKDLDRIGFTKRQNFFKTLKKVSPTKWKKAVKLFYQEIA